MARPTRKASSTAAAAIKRARSSSLSATDTESPPPPKRTSKAKASTFKASKASTSSTKAKPPLTKTASSRKSIAFPPSGLEGPYPSRLGFPAFQFPKAASKMTAPGAGNGVNGGIPTKSTEVKPLLIGAHVSMAGGPATALLRGAKLGANGVALFVKGHRTWKSKPIEDDAIEKFREMMKPQSEGGRSMWRCV